ncbi:MAG: hypothetical protein IK115_00130 [Lachnospiraceae bacterium]|nr:hypothetical protein [Lachnospiraceae bacterium]
MRLEEDYDEYDEEREELRGRSARSMKGAGMIIALFVLLTIGIVVIANQGSGNTTGSGQPVEHSPAADSWNNPDHEEVTALVEGGRGTAEDLDFWYAYPTKTPEMLTVSVNEPTPTESAEEATPEEDKPSVSEDGMHTLIRYDDGTQEWADINPYLSRNNYDFSGLVYKKPFMSYYENNSKRSFTGVDISKDEDFVDFKLLKRSGVDFVMLRLGQRGYSTGEISLDDNFVENYQRAAEAELDVGVYFVTAAITTEEAKEEADFCIRTLSENQVVLTYPLALSTKQLGSGKARTDDLEKMPRTNCALTFMRTVEQAGFFSLLYGDKATLIKKYSLGSMIAYDIWYSEQADIPDYPYQFVMWQYDLGGKVDGIAGGARLNLCFMDYKVR